MKKNFLWAAAVYALCSSCETADEPFVYEEQQPAAMAQKTHSADAYETYQNIMTGFDYDGELSYEANLLRFEAHVNLVMPYYYGEETLDYEPIDLDKAAVLAAAGTDFIDGLAYSGKAKTMIHAVLNHSFAGMDTDGLNEEELRLVQTLFVLHNDNGGDDYNDDKLDDIRTIAFAYGAQYSFTQAVLYAGAMELMSQWGN